MAKDISCIKTYTGDVWPRIFHQSHQLKSGSVAVCLQVDPASIVGMWLLDEGSGDVAKDTSGNGNDGNIDNAEWTDDGRFGKALEFDGGAHVAIPANATTDDIMDGFTYLLWVKPLGPPPNPNTRVMERDWHNPTIQISSAGDFYVSTVVAGGLDNNRITGGAWEMGEWSFVAFTYDGDKLALYVDGELIGEVAVGKPDATNNADGGAIWLGSWKDPGWSYTGLIDDVGAFNVALSAEDIQGIMNNGLDNVAAVSSEGKLAETWGHIKGL